MFDLVVTRLVNARPPRGYSLTCFADDLAAALGNAISGLRALVSVLLEMRPAAGLVLQVRETKLLNFSDRDDFELRRRLADIPLAGSFAVPRFGIYLGVLVGTEALGREFDDAVLKYHAMHAHPQHSGILWGTSSCASGIRFQRSSVIRAGGRGTSARSFAGGGHACRVAWLPLTGPGSEVEFYSGFCALDATPSSSPKY